MRSARIGAAAVSFSVAVLLILPHTVIAQRAPVGRMGGYVSGPIGRRAGAFLFHRGFSRDGFQDGFRRRFGGGFDRPLLGPIGFGFPHRRFFGFPGDRFGVFGFPHRHFGFFFDGFGFFGGFPVVHGFVFFDGFRFIDGFPIFAGFPHRRGFFGFPHRRFGFLGFADRGFGFFGPQGVPLGVPFGFTPFFGASGGSALPYAGGPYPAETLAASHGQRVSDTRPALGRQLAVPGTGSAAGDSLVVERVSVMDVVPATALRLTWRSAGLQAEQVALFLADTAQGVLTAQTLRAPPFTALFEPPPGTAFAGMTVAWPDGTTSTRLVPYRFPRR